MFLHLFMSDDALKFRLPKAIGEVGSEYNSIKLNKQQ